MRKSVVILKGDFASSSLVSMLKKHFDSVSQMSIDDAISNLDTIAVLVLPGIAGERSPYPALLTSERTTRLHDAIHSGLIMHTDCAASYYMARDITYRRSDGEILMRNGLGWIEMSAVGPITSSTPENADDYTYYKTRMVDVVLNDGTETSIGYGNGPVFFEETLDESVTPLARYKRSQNMIAGLVKDMGQGKLISMGILPQIEYTHLKGRMNNPIHEQHRSFMESQLRANDEGRRHLEQKIIGLYRHAMPHATL